MNVVLRWVVTRGLGVLCGSDGQFEFEFPDSPCRFEKPEQECTEEPEQTSKSGFEKMRAHELRVPLVALPVLSPRGVLDFTRCLIFDLED